MSPLSFFLLHSRRLQSLHLGSLVRNALVFLLVVLFLAAWRGLADAAGLLSDGTVGLDWIHRTFMITTVYTCGSTLICHVMKS